MHPGIPKSGRLPVREIIEPELNEVCRRAAVVKGKTSKETIQKKFS